VGADEYRNDPENERISHYNRRRLTYEEMRDSLLASSGRLAATSVQQPSGSKLTGGLLARTAFEPQDRKKANVTSAIFDGPDPKSIVPQRAETTTTPQALFLMNNGLVTESAVALAGRLRDDESLKTDTDRIRRLWLVLYNRPAAGDEVEMAERFLAENTWEELISALYCTNEFAYID
jgi:hypothetical protein